MTETTPMTGVAGAELEPGLPQRVAMVFASPVKLGAALRAQAPWFWTLVPVVAISALIWILVPGDVLRATAEAGMAGRGAGGGPDPAEMVRFMRISGVVGAVVGPFVAAAAIGGLMYVLFSVFSGQETGFRQHTSAAAHIFWITTLGALLTFPLWIVKQDLQVSLSLGLLLPEASESLFGRVLNAITIFGLWSSVALGAVESGLSDGRIPVGKAVGIVLTLYLLWALAAGFMGGIFPGM